MHNQTFYKGLQQQAIEPIVNGDKYTKEWADVGCSTGLMSRLGNSLRYRVTGFDINTFSLFIARLLSWRLTNISYSEEDFYTLEKKFDVVSATSLLSVVDNKKETLEKLVSLLKNNESALIIIEPTSQMTKKNVKKLMTTMKKKWFYKGLLLWASAREGKDILPELFDSIQSVNISHNYFLERMVRITYIHPKR